MSTKPETEPGNGAGGIDTGLSIEQALLPGDAFPPPWEPQGRRLDRIGDGTGPNQTDCGPYWALEELRAGGGGVARWWIDGGNANHHVRRSDANDLGRLLELAAIAEQCPTVRWSEGGSFTVELVDVGDDAIGLKLTDESTVETTWIAIAAHGDLLSVLEVPLWTNADGEMLDFDRDELDRLAQLMNDRMRSADVVPLTTAPPSSVAPSTVAATTAPPPATTPAPTTTIAVTGLGTLLLGSDDRPPEFSAPRVRPHRPDEPDADLVADCPAAVSIESIDAVLEWFSTTEADRVEVDQFLGRAESAAEASKVVRRFGETAEWDPVDLFGEDAEMSGGEVAISRSDAAANLVVRLPDDGFLGEIIAVAIDDIVMIVSVSGELEDEPGSRPLDPDLTDSLAEAAVAKVRAADR